MIDDNNKKHCSERSKAEEGRYTVSSRPGQSSSMASPYAAAGPNRSVAPYSSSLLRPLLPVVRVVLGVPGVTVLEEKLLLVLGCERTLCGRRGDGRLALEDRTADAGPEYEPVANGFTDGVACDSVPCCWDREGC